MATGADHLLLEGLQQVALHVRLRETIDDGHPVDFFVVLRLDVLPGEVLEDRRTDLHAVTVRQGVFAPICSSLTYVPFVEPSSTANHCVSRWTKCA